MRPRRRLLAWPAVVLYSCLVGALLAEAVVRVALPPPRRIAVFSLPDRRGGDAGVGGPGPLRKMVGGVRIGDFMINTPTGRRLRPDTEAIIMDPTFSDRELTYRTNSLGFRNPELGPKTRSRVLFLGDSIAFGYYLQEEETFVRRVEALSLRSGAPLETINAAVPSIGIETELAILMESGLRADPDVVVLDFYLNDVQESPGVRILQLPRFLEWSALAGHLARFLVRPRPFALSEEEVGLMGPDTNEWLQELREKLPAGPGDPRHDRAAFNGLIQENYADWGSAWTDAAWRRMDPVLEAFRRQADAHRLRLLLVALPVSFQVDADFVDDRPQRRLRQVAERLRIPMLDLLPLLRRARQESGEGLYYDHCHTRAAADARIAEWILEFIRRNSP